MANRGAQGLSGCRSRLFYDALRILRAIQRVNPRVLFAGECVATWAPWLAHDFDSVGVVLGVLPVILDSRQHSYCCRERALWANFEVFACEDGWDLDVNQILEAGRAIPGVDDAVPKMPTIVASVNSYSQSTAVYDYNLGEWTPPTVVEAERAMGLPDGYSDGGLCLPVTERWRVLGNGFQVDSFMCVMKGLDLKFQQHLVNTFIQGVRDGVQQSGSPFMENEDGPSELQRAIKKMRRMARVMRATGASAKDRSKVYGAWPTVQACPETGLLTRQGGVRQARNMSLEEYVAAVRADMIVLSRAPSTWKSYAAWWQVFMQWVRRRVVNLNTFSLEVAKDELKNLVALLLRKYAYSTLNMLVTAVNAVLQDSGGC